jgi:hypothetical protein
MRGTLRLECKSEAPRDTLDAQAGKPHRNVLASANLRGALWNATGIERRTIADHSNGAVRRHTATLRVARPQRYRTPVTPLPRRNLRAHKGHTACPGPYAEGYAESRQPSARLSFDRV